MHSLKIINVNSSFCLFLIVVLTSRIPEIVIHSRMKTVKTADVVLFSEIISINYLNLIRIIQPFSRNRRFAFWISSEEPQCSYSQDTRPL
jgi:hypothetical protein